MPQLPASIRVLAGATVLLRQRLCWLAGLGLLLSPLPTGELFAQPPGSRTTKPKSASPAAPGASQPRSLPGATAEPPPPSPDLPAGYEPPAPPNELLILVNELLTPQEVEDFKKIRVKYSSALRNGSNSNTDKQLIADGLKYRLYIMTMEDKRRELHELRQDLISSDLQNAGRIMKAEDVRAFRKSLLDQILKLIEPLLKNNFYVRLHAVTLLGELDWMAEDSVRGLKHETYWPACTLLIKVLQDPEQPIPVKISAARSMVRLVRFGDVPVALRHEIASAVLAELAKPDTHYWYQMRLAEVLSTLDVSLDLQTRQPFVVNGLLNVVRDSKRDFRARAEAAKALGRVPIDREVDVSAMMRDLMKLALDLGSAAQQDPAAAMWEQCFFNLYLAYRPIDSSDKDATKKSLAGLLNNPQTASAAQPTLKLVLPMVNAVINGNAVGVADVQAIQAWLQQNSPNPPSNIIGNNGTSTPTAQPTQAAP